MRRALIVFLAFTSLPLFAQGKEIDRTISVSGEAVIMVAPNQAVVTIGVETFDPSLEAASQTNDRIARTLIAEWKSLGVPDSSIQTSGVTVDIAYARNSEHAKKVEGYVVSRSYDVTADSAATAERIITRGLASGANQIGRVDLRTTEMRKYRDQARVSAVKAAREKAELIASQLRVSVGAPRTISETTSYYSWGGSRQNMMSQNVTSYASEGGDGETSGAVAPGKIAVRASVSIVFDLIPKP